MALPIPSFSDIVKAFNAVLKSNVPELDPDKRNSFAKALFTSNANMVNNINIRSQLIYNDSFIASATSDALDLHAKERGLERFKSERATGQAVVDVSASTSLQSNDINVVSSSLFIAKNTVFSTVNNDYNNRFDSNSTWEQYEITVVTFNSGTNTTQITFLNQHNLAVGVKVYFKITIDVDNTFTSGFYLPVIDIIDDLNVVFSGDLSSLVAGDFANVNLAVLNIISVDVGSEQNLVNGSQLTSDIDGNSYNAFVSQDRITGGRDNENDSDLRNRLLEAWSNIKAGFTEFGISQFFDDNGFNYKFSPVRAYDGTVQHAGFMTLYLLNQDDSLLTTLEINNVKSKLFSTSTGIVSIQTPPENVIVSNATLVPRDFVFLNISPNLQSLKDAIVDSLKDFFMNETMIGNDVRDADYKNAILRAVDDLGNTVQSYNLTSPTTDLVTNIGQKNILGTVTFN